MTTYRYKFIARKKYINNPINKNGKINKTHNPKLKNRSNNKGYAYPNPEQ